MLKILKKNIKYWLDTPFPLIGKGRVYTRYKYTNSAAEVLKKGRATKYWNMKKHLRMHLTQLNLKLIRNIVNLTGEFLLKVIR